MPSRSPRFVVGPVDLKSDWDELITSYWGSWKKPVLALARLKFPHIGENIPEEAASPQRIKRTLSSPEDVWIKAVDTRTRKIVGGASWKKYSDNPYRDGRIKPFQAVWWEEGSEMKELTEEIFTKMRSLRPKLVACKHACQ